MAKIHVARALQTLATTLTAYTERKSYPVRYLGKL